MIAGDLVVMRSMITAAPSDRGTAMIELLQLERGRIAGQPDVLQSATESAANDTTMF